MQPHIPYIGETAKLLYQAIRENGISIKSQEHLFNTDPNQDSFDYVDFLSASADGIISDKMVKMMYHENLELVLESVQDLLEDLDGKTVITTDHGELLGERCWSNFSQKYGHPDEISPALRLVPWHEIHSSPRREINSESPVGADFVDKNVRDQQLKALGYK